MIPGSRRKTWLFGLVGACALAASLALSLSWITLNFRIGLMYILGIVFFCLVIAGVVLNTIFLMREVRRNEQQDAFLNAMTHELKTPVTSIRLYLETLQKRPVDEAKRQEFYRIMHDDSDRLLQTIEQVLRASQSSVKRQPRRERVDFPRLVEEVVEIARKRHHLESDALQLQLPQNPSLAVQGDPEELQTAVTNLVENAIKYSGPNLRVVVNLRLKEGQTVALSVTDDGVGIPSGDLKRIFKRFYRVQNAWTQKVKGTGLGLFIVNNVAKKHGGRAYAQSAGAGKGSTFTIELPRMA